MPKKSKSPVAIEQIDAMIHTIRGTRVMLDRDLAKIYGVPTKVFNQAVKRNRQRFPEDFMFQLTLEEAKALQASWSQIVTLKRGQNTKYLPHAAEEKRLDRLLNYFEKIATLYHMGIVTLEDLELV